MSGDFLDERCDLTCFALLEETDLIPSCFLGLVEPFFGEGLDDPSWLWPELWIVSSDLGFPELVGSTFDLERKWNIGDDSRCVRMA